MMLSLKIKEDNFNYKFNLNIILFYFIYYILFAEHTRLLPKLMLYST